MGHREVGPNLSSWGDLGSACNVRRMQQEPLGCSKPGSPRPLTWASARGSRRAGNRLAPRLAAGPGGQPPAAACGACLAKAIARAVMPRMCQARLLSQPSISRPEAAIQLPTTRRPRASQRCPAVWGLPRAKGPRLPQHPSGPLGQPFARHHLHADRCEGDQGQLEVLDAEGDPHDRGEAGQG